MYILAPADRAAQAKDSMPGLPKQERISSTAMFSGIMGAILVLFLADLHSLVCLLPQPLLPQQPCEYTLHLV
jgi:hypothetical protein